MYIYLILYVQKGYGPLLVTHHLLMQHDGHL